MPTFIIRQLIADLQKQTETILNKAITQWLMLPPKTLLFKQDETKWSANQCLMHLNSYGLYYIPAIQASIEAAESKEWLSTESFKSSFFGNWFTEIMQPKGEEQTLKKMKSPKEHTPVINENSDIVLAEFIDHQETLLQLLEKAKSFDIRKTKRPVSISRFIKLPLGDTFRFLIAHNQQHVLQAERTMNFAQDKTQVV